jgi:hypothetical protein
MRRSLRDPPNETPVRPANLKIGKRTASEVAFTFAWTRLVVEAQGWEYEVWSEPPPALLENVRFLAGYRRDWLFRHNLLDAAWPGPGSVRPSLPVGGPPASRPPSSNASSEKHAPAANRTVRPHKEGLYGTRGLTLAYSWRPAPNVCVRPGWPGVGTRGPFPAPA